MRMKCNIQCQVAIVAKSPCGHLDATRRSQLFCPLPGHESSRRSAKRCRQEASIQGFESHAAFHLTIGGRERTNSAILRPKSARPLGALYHPASGATTSESSPDAQPAPLEIWVGYWSPARPVATLTAHRPLPLPLQNAWKPGLADRRPRWSERGRQSGPSPDSANSMSLGHSGSRPKWTRPSSCIPPHSDACGHSSEQRWRESLRRCRNRAVCRASWQAPGRNQAP